MAITVGINGFGRIGRSVFRILSHRDDINVLAINDLFENEQLAYLLKYDTVMGIFPKAVKVEGNSMDVNGSKVVMTAHRDPSEIPWKDLGVQVVIESTGVFRHREPLEKHFAVGGAGSVGDNTMSGFEFGIVYPQDYGGIDFVFGRNGQDHFFSPGCKMFFQGFSVTEDTGGFDNNLDPQLLPGNLSRITVCGHRHRVSIDIH